MSDGAKTGWTNGWNDLVTSTSLSFWITNSSSISLNGVTLSKIGEFGIGSFKIDDHCGGVVESVKIWVLNWNGSLNKWNWWNRNMNWSGLRLRSSVGWWSRWKRMWLNVRKIYIRLIHDILKNIILSLKMYCSRSVRKNIRYLYNLQKTCGLQSK